MSKAKSKPASGISVEVADAGESEVKPPEEPKPEEPKPEEPKPEEPKPEGDSAERKAEEELRQRRAKEKLEASLNAGAVSAAKAFLERAESLRPEVESRDRSAAAQALELIEVAKKQLARHTAVSEDEDAYRAAKAIDSFEREVRRSLEAPEGMLWVRAKATCLYKGMPRMVGEPPFLMTQEDFEARKVRGEVEKARG